MPGQTFTREFKLAVVRQLATGEKHPAQACREYGLADSVLARWRCEYAERGDAAFTPKTMPAETSTSTTTTEARIAEMERFRGQLALENAVSKKALQTLQNGQHGANGPAAPSVPSRSDMP